VLKGTDILENEIIKQYPDVLERLLKDHTTKKNILWSTNNYEYLGETYSSDSHIFPDLITGDNGNIIMPRVNKEKIQQQTRSKEMAEIFTPSWICNAQNNLIDNNWFGRENVFNMEILSDERSNTWETNKQKITYPEGKTWKDYIREKRIEIACGEAPYITSRYDTTTGDFIPIENRIGFLDRKLRIINENIEATGDWLKAAQTAYKNTYAYEWQGDSLLLAREAMLISFVENYQYKFREDPLLKSIQYIAYIISWNAWQMDGLKGVIPNSCGNKLETIFDLFGNYNTKTACKGCLINNIFKHDGIYCLIKDWSNKDLITGRAGREIKFVDLLNKQKK